MKIVYSNKFFINLLLIIAVAFILGCSNDVNIPNANTDPNPVGSVKLVISRWDSRSIVPILPDPESFNIKISNEESTVYENVFEVGEDVVIKGLKVGSYTVVVDALSKGNTIYSGENIFDVRADEETSCIVMLRFIQNGTGAMAVNLSWDISSGSGTPFEEALNRGSLGFQAINNSTKLPLSNTGIQYVSDLSSGEYRYVEEGLVPTEGTEIVFYIYSKINGIDVVIGKTFKTTVQIYKDLLSIPDENEVYNFRLDSNNMISYLKNVEAVDYTLPKETADEEMIVRWTNPIFTSEYYPITTAVTLTDKTTGDAQVLEVLAENGVDSEKECKFSGLSPKQEYSVSFQLKTKIGYSQEECLIDSAKTKYLVKQIEFTNEFKDVYIQGDEIEISAKTYPEEALEDYTIEVSENGIVDGNTVSFTKYGDNRITITSVDNPKVSEYKDVRYILPTPDNFKVNLKRYGAELTWDPVANAECYEIIRTKVSGEGEDTQIVTTEGTSFVDDKVYSNSEYSYSIRAIVDSNSEYNSIESTLSIKMPKSLIEIVLPSLSDAVISDAFANINGKFIDITDPESKLTISIKEIPDATNFKWVLGERTLASYNSFVTSIETITIDKNSYPYLSSYEQSVPLVFSFKVGDATYSATSYIWFVEGNPEKMF